MQPETVATSHSSPHPPAPATPVPSRSAIWLGCVLVFFGVLVLPFAYQHAMAWISGSLISTVNVSTVRIVCFGAIALGILAGWIKERGRVNGVHAVRADEITRIEWKQQELRAKGDASESMVGQALLALAQEIDPTAWLGNGMVMTYPQSRPDQLSRFEVDNLLITRFGVFLVEVKHWKNPVTITASGWALEKASGVESVASPIEQSAPKHRVLRQLANQACINESRMPVESIVVLSHPNARFPVCAPAQVLTIADLRYYLRLAYLRALENGIPSVHDVKRVRKAIDGIHDKDPMAKHHFLLELAAKKGYSLDYREYENTRLALMNLPKLQPRPFWRSWATYFPLALALGVMGIFQTQLRHAEAEKPSTSLSANASTGAAAPLNMTVTTALTSAVTQHKKRH